MEDERVSAKDSTSLEDVAACPRAQSVEAVEHAVFPPIVLATTGAIVCVDVSISSAPSAIQVSQGLGDKLGNI